MKSSKRRGISGNDGKNSTSPLGYHRVVEKRFWLEFRGRRSARLVLGNAKIEDGRG
jgi:hypothetical protein